MTRSTWRNVSSMRSPPTELKLAAKSDSTTSGTHIKCGRCSCETLGQNAVGQYHASTSPARARHVERPPAGARAAQASAPPPLLVEAQQRGLARRRQHVERVGRHALAYAELDEALARPTRARDDKPNVASLRRRRKQRRE